MAEYKDYYNILGVGKNATDAEIKKAFKTQARKCHPDMHPESEKAKWTEKFKDLNEAYTVLSDKQKRTITTKWAKKVMKATPKAAGPAAPEAAAALPIVATPTNNTSNTAALAMAAPLIIFPAPAAVLTGQILVISSKAFLEEWAAWVVWAVFPALGKILAALPQPAPNRAMWKPN